MLDPKHLLDQMLNGKVGGRMEEAGQLARNRLNRASGAQGFAGGAVAGGLLGLLLGSKKSASWLRARWVMAVPPRSGAGAPGVPELCGGPLGPFNAHDEAR
jgi:uncharacterized membrane protein YebE (DUF533 family)